MFQNSWAGEEVLADGTNVIVVVLVVPIDVAIVEAHNPSAVGTVGIF